MKTETEVMAALDQSVEAIDGIIKAKQAGIPIANEHIEQVLTKAGDAAQHASAILFERNPELCLRVLKKILRELESGLPAS